MWPERAAFYSKGPFDIEYEFPFGDRSWRVAYAPITICGSIFNARAKPLDYFDEETKERFVPTLSKPSAESARTVLALIGACL